MAAMDCSGMMTFGVMPLARKLVKYITSSASAPPVTPPMRSQ